MKKDPNKKTREAESSSVSQNSTASPVHRSVRKQLLVYAGILCFLAIGTTLAVMYGRGYRFFFQGSPKISKTGILHVTSNPNGANIWIDGHISGTTDTSINLPPKKYSITVGKDGYNSWQKDVDIEAEVVTNIEARLFPKAPSLQSITTFGIEEALIDPTGKKIAFKIASESAQKRRGIYIFDMTQRGLPILPGQSSSTQLVDDTIDKFSLSTLSFSPDGKELLASISAALDDPEISPTPNLEIVPPDAESPPSASSELSTYYLLRTDGFNNNPRDVTATSINVLEAWQNERANKENQRIRKLKPKVAEFGKKHFRILSWSPDEKKILYQATASAQMPVFLTPRRIGNNLRYERRDLKEGAVYIYNITEDLNTRIIDTVDEICPHNGAVCESEDTIANPFSWFPDSKHLIYLKDRKIHLVEDDGSNMTTIYAGPFLGEYVFAWPDSSKIVILTNLGNASVAPTLYTIGLK